jgi:hypothetical protein
VHDERDHGKQQQQVDEKAADMHQRETAEPQHNQNNREDKKHEQSCFLPAKSLAPCLRALLFSKRGRCDDSLLGMKTNAERMGRDNATGKDSIYANRRKFRRTIAQGDAMLILLIILLVLAFGAFPTWPYSRSWGYYPSGGLGLVLLIVLIVALLNHGF